MSNALPPRCAARYHLVRLIGSGAHGSVFLAQQAQLNRPVAVKVLHPDLARDVEAVERFAHEAKLTAGLAHPNVVRVIEHDLDDEQPWIAYEYLDGLTLHQIVQRGAMQWRAAVQAAMQVAAALDAAHTAGILHRDVKPSNVIESGSGTYKLTDFGLARLIEGYQKLTRTGCIVGTPAYLAPEVMTGGEYAPAADLFATGAMLFKLATGQLPPRHDLLGGSPVQQATLVPPSQLSRGLPPALDRLVLGCMQRDPAARFASARAFRQAAAEALADPKGGVTLPSSARGAARTKGFIAPRERAPGGLGRRVRLLAAGVTLACIAVIAVAARQARRVHAWVDIPPGASPATSPAPVRRALPDAPRFEALLARVRHRWALHGNLLGLLNPIHTDVPEAARQAAALVQPARADHGELARMADALWDTCPDLAAAGPEAQHWLARTTAARFTAWSYVQVISQMQAATERIVAAGRAYSADSAEVLGSFESMEFGRDGLILIRRYQAAALATFARMCETPDTAGEDAFDLLFDAREIARMRGLGHWARRDDEELRRLAGQFREGLSKLPGAAGAALARLVTRFWEWGDPNGKVRMTRASYEEALADVDALARAMPAARQSLARLTHHMRDEMSAFPKASGK